MGLILGIETATTVCSVALYREGVVISSKEIREVNSHAQHLTLLIKDIASDLKQLDAVAVSMGPGSYTGLRIGVSTAKGLCYGLGKPLIAINTLQAMAKGMTLKFKPSKGTLLCPMIDARRMEVYNAVFDHHGEFILPTNAAIIDENSFASLLEKNRIIFAGDGASKCSSVIQHPNATFENDIYPSAEHMDALAETSYLEKKFEDVAYFEPFYLKDFVGTVSKKS